MRHYHQLAWRHVFKIRKRAREKCSSRPWSEECENSLEAAWPWLESLIQKIECLLLLEDKKAC
jgi:hypothetical protein